MLFTALAFLPLALAAPLNRRLAPIKRATHQARALEGGYIVSIKPNTVNPNNRGGWFERVMTEAGVTAFSTPDSLKLNWNETVFNGLAGTFSEDELFALRAREEVNYIDPDYTVHVLDTVQQEDTTWGISRLSLGPVSLAGNDPSELQYPYFSDDTAGAGTDIYILDTGIRTTHVEFSGRATFLASFGNGVPGQDRNGHGTHVAGTAAGKKAGVAKQANIFAIKVFSDDGSGQISDILSGINLALQRFLQNPGRPAVVNMSLGGPLSTPLDSAVSNAIAQGLPFCVAAGNESQDAENVSPARVPEAITVGATDINDSMAVFSNFGAPVDIFAPGVDIIAAAFDSDQGGAVLSGTSMSTPHIAGLSALIMGQEGQMTPAQLEARIKELAINNVIRGVPRGTTNALAFNAAVDPATLIANFAPGQAQAPADGLGGSNGSANAGGVAGQ